MRARDRTLTLWLQASQPLDLTLPDAASCAELRTALVEHGVEESEHGTASGMPTGAEEASPPSDTKDQARSARELLVTLFCVGLALALAGGLIVGASWPGPATDSSGDDHNGVWFGLILGAIGQVLAFIAVVGWGVMLGLRASGVAVPKTESQT